MPSASLTIKGLDAFSFLGVTTDGGRIPDVPRREAVRLAAASVDGDRWQVQRRAFPAFGMRSLTDVADDAAALKLASLYEQAMYLSGTLSITRPAGSRAWKVLILDVQPVVLAGQTFGAGATGLRTVRAAWTLQVLESP